MKRIRLLLQEGQSTMETCQDSISKTLIRHINCYKAYVPEHSMQEKEVDTAELQGLINRNTHRKLPTASK